MLILCVEDESFLRDDLVEELTLAGYDVVEACNGEQALERLQACRPDLILTDVSMPRMNGYDLLTKLKRERLTNAPVLFMTAFDEAEVALRGGEMPDALIRKPVDYSDLLNILKGFQPIKAA